VAQKFHFAILRIEVTRASRGVSAISELLVLTSLSLFTVTLTLSNLTVSSLLHNLPSVFPTFHENTSNFELFHWQTENVGENSTPDKSGGDDKYDERDDSLRQTVSLAKRSGNLPSDFWRTRVVSG